MADFPADMFKKQQLPVFVVNVKFYTTPLPLGDGWGVCLVGAHKIWNASDSSIQTSSLKQDTLNEHSLKKPPVRFFHDGPCDFFCSSKSNAWYTEGLSLGGHILARMTRMCKFHLLARDLKSCSDHNYVVCVCVCVLMHQGQLCKTTFTSGAFSWNLFTKCQPAVFHTNISYSGATMSFTQWSATTAHSLTANLCVGIMGNPPPHLRIIQQPGETRTNFSLFVRLEVTLKVGWGQETTADRWPLWSIDGEVDYWLIQR